MARQNVIGLVMVTTDWFSSMVITPKRNGGIRICVDLTLNNGLRGKFIP